VSSCRQWADRSVLACKAWAEERRQECLEWGDEGYRACEGWEEERKKDCCDWVPCSWACEAWVWVTSWFCKGWYWVAKWICYGWTWVVTAVCVVWGWVTVTACGLLSIIVCAIKGLIDAIASIFGGASKPKRQVEHIFVLMLENRSFDHMLGFSGITGMDPTGAPTSIDGVSVGGGFTNSVPGSGQEVEVRAQAAYAIATDVGDPGHDFDDVRTQLGADFSGGVYTVAPEPNSNRGFVASYAGRGSSDPRSIMNCFGPRQLPVLNALAREYAVCDGWFSSLPGPTFPNRFFAHAASSGGLDDSPAGWEVGVATLFDGFRFNNGSIFDALDDACIDWEVVQGDEFPATLSLAGMTFNAVVRDRFTYFSDFVARLDAGGTAPPYVFIEPHYGNILPWTSEDYTCGNSQHPLDDVTAGEQLIKDTYEAIRNSSIWESSLLIVTWDEHGGFYDHLRPGPAVPPGDGVSDVNNPRHGFRFEQLGVRVPAVVVSPLVPRGTIDHTTYDHPSIPKTIERNFDLGPLTDRDAAASDVLHLLSGTSPRMTAAEAPTTLPPPASSGLSCSSIIDLIDGMVTQTPGDAPTSATDERPEEKDGTEKDDGRGQARGRRGRSVVAETEDLRRRKEDIPPDVRGVEIVALLREMSLMRRWDARGRLNALKRFRRRSDPADVRRYVADVRAMVRAREARSTSVSAELRPLEMEER
jgi:phospholipase C